jgi:hypothetical protein
MPCVEPTLSLPNLPAMELAESSELPELCTVMAWILGRISRS